MSKGPIIRDPQQHVPIKDTVDIAKHTRRKVPGNLPPRFLWAFLGSERLRLATERQSCKHRVSFEG